MKKQWAGSSHSMCDFQVVGVSILFRISKFEFRAFPSSGISSSACEPHTLVGVRNQIPMRSE